MKNKTFRKLMKSNQKSLVMEPIFIDSNEIRYYLFGSQSLLQCLYREKLNDNNENNLMVYDFDGYIFEDEDEKIANNGMYFGNLECVAIGLESLEQFKDTIKSSKPKLCSVMDTIINKIKLIETQTMTEYRKKQMNQQNEMVL